MDNKLDLERLLSIFKTLSSEDRLAALIEIERALRTLQESALQMPVQHHAYRQAQN